MRCVQEERETGWCIVHEVKCYENHATDARVKRIETAPTGGGYTERMLR